MFLKIYLTTIHFTLQITISNFKNLKYHDFEGHPNAPLVLYWAKTLFFVQVGFSHSNILRTIIQHACVRLPSLVPCRNSWNASFRRLQSEHRANINRENREAQKVFVIFGGETSERQVSLMSGTNVWLNLQHFDDVNPTSLLIIESN